MNAVMLTLTITNSNEYTSVHLYTVLSRYHVPCLNRYHWAQKRIEVTPGLHTCKSVINIEMQMVLLILNCIFKNR